MTWIQQRGAELITASSTEQRDAIKALLAQSVRERHSVDELARLIRPCIGLTEPQAKANLRYYENITSSLRKQHPKMKAETIQRRAREAASKLSLIHISNIIQATGSTSENGVLFLFANKYVRR